MFNKKWITNNKINNSEKVSGIANLPLKVLNSREIYSEANILDYLDTSFKKINDPYEFADMGIAVDRIISAIENQEKICVYGDYDVDGICSVAILYDFLNSQGADIWWTIPDRKDGYGLSLEGCEQIASMGTSLVITVDCGIVSVDEINFLNSKGIETIVTDHHQCKEIIPDAIAILCATLPDNTYPFKSLCGAGVALKLVHGLCAENDNDKKWMEYLDFAAIATICDIVPLVDENRAIVKNGLEIIRKSSRQGIIELIKVCAIEQKSIDAISIAFKVGPRINAAGRMGDAKRAVELLIAKDNDKAIELAKVLNDENIKRQGIQRKIYTESQELMKDNEIEVLTKEDWHLGIIGIVASKLVEKYNKPFILLSEENGVLRGSSRSVKGINIFDALSECSEYLDEFGGHELAAGLSFKKENLDQFTLSINKSISEIKRGKSIFKSVDIDSVINIDEVNVAEVESLDILKPYGYKNTKPVFQINNINIRNAKAIGKNNAHLKMKLYNGRKDLDAIAFRKGSLALGINPNVKFDVIGTLDLNTWQNRTTPQINIIDIRPSGQLLKEYKISYIMNNNIEVIELKEYNDDKLNIKAMKIKEILDKNNIQYSGWFPERKDIETVYKTLNKRPEKNIIADDIYEMTLIISNLSDYKVNPFMLIYILSILEELEVIKITDEEVLKVEINSVASKRALNTSKLMEVNNKIMNMLLKGRN